MTDGYFSTPGFSRGILLIYSLQITRYCEITLTELDLKLYKCTVWTLNDAVSRCRMPGLDFFLKSEIAIASLLRQTNQPKKFLLGVKTITKLLGNGIAETVKSCNLHQAGSFKT